MISVFDNYVISSCLYTYISNLVSNFVSNHILSIGNHASMQGKGNSVINIELIIKVSLRASLAIGLNPQIFYLCFSVRLK